jgi:NAD-dependent SIR2 family protein deacetylase
MLTEFNEPSIEPDDFARRFSMRANRLMWLLGAGASASAGIPTAWDMIWEFKQQLYVSQRRVPLNAVSDLSNPAVRNKLQNYVDSSERFPRAGAADEYAALFEAAWPSEIDRRTYIASKVSGAKPSYGHIALATLMRAGLTKVVWTTNFDTLIADACAKVYDGTSHLSTVSLDTPHLGAEVLDGDRGPAEIKLHGDFRSRRLKNTTEELRRQDVQLRQILVDACQHSGLVVAGYSGRDDSIMDALEEAAARPNAYPAGLFWLHRGDDPPLERVSRLLSRVSEYGIECGLVRIDSFDESLRDITRLVKGIDRTSLESFANERRVWTPAAPPNGARGFPVVRLNGLHIDIAPTVCRRVVCNIGGSSDVSQVVEAANVDMLVARTRSGVLAFGSDSDVRATFEPFDIQAFDLHSIEQKRLRYESGERGLLRSALSRALAREHNLALTRRRNVDLLVPKDPMEPLWGPLRKLVGHLSGAVTSHPSLFWREGIIDPAWAILNYAA